MNRTNLISGLLLVLGLATFAVGCGTDSGRSSGNVMDITWSGESGYDARYQRSRDRHRNLVQQIRKYDEAYYASHVNTQDAAGNQIKPVDQVTFNSDTPNVKEGTITTAGVKAKVKTEEAAVFIDSNGNEVGLSSFLGKPLLLVFTRGFPGYICPMCTTYTAQITVNHQKFVDLGAEVLVVFPGRAAQVDNFVAACKEIADSDNALPFPVLLDPDLKAVAAFNIRADMSLPATYIFDGKGVVRWGFVGEKPHERPSVECLLEEVAKLAGGN